MDTTTQSDKTQLPRFFEISEKIEYLLSLVDLGYWIFPLHDMTWVDGKPRCTCHLGERCPGPGKHPDGKWSQPLDPALSWTKEYIRNIVALWPDRGWGLHAGRSSLCVLDVDPRHGGNETLAELVRVWQISLDEPTTKTGGGGSHRFYSADSLVDQIKGWPLPSGKRSTNIALGPGVEFFSGQHYVVLPYSPHASGGWYAPGSMTSLGPVPAPMVSHIQNMEVKNGQKQNAACVPQKTPRDDVPAERLQYFGGEKISTRAKSWLSVRDPAISGQGGRKKMMGAVTELVINFALPIPECWQLLSQYNSRAVPPFSDRELHEMIVWAEAQPGERGSKITNPFRPGRPPCGEDLSWLDTVDIEIHGREWITRIMHTGETELIPLPRQPVLTEDELRGFGNEPLDVTVIKVRPYRSDEAPGLERQNEFLSEPSHKPDGCFPDSECRLEQLTPVTLPRQSHQCCTCGGYFAGLSLTEPEWLRFWSCGRSWRCDYCREKRIKEHEDQIDRAFDEWAKTHGGLDAESLYYSICPRINQVRIMATLRGLHSYFFRLHNQAMGRLRGEAAILISTEEPHIGESVLITPRAAKKLLLDALRAMSIEVVKQFFFSSREWKKERDEMQKQPKLGPCKPIRHSQVTIDEVASHYPHKIKKFDIVSGCWSSPCVSYRVSPFYLPHFARDMDAGAPLDKIALDMGLDPDNLPIGGDGTEFDNHLE